MSYVASNRKRGAMRFSKQGRHAPKTEEEEGRASADAEQLWARAGNDMSKGIGMGEGVTIGGRYRLGKEIGRGAFGNVFHALDLTSGSTVAVKRVALGGMGRQELEGLQSELLLLQTLRHRNIVRCKHMLVFFLVLVKLHVGIWSCACLGPHQSIDGSCVYLCVYRRYIDSLVYRHRVQLDEEDEGGGLVNGEEVEQLCIVMEYMENGALTQVHTRSMTFHPFQDFCSCR